jgi:hypothetical protein
MLAILEGNCRPLCHQQGRRTLPATSTFKDAMQQQDPDLRTQMTRVMLATTLAWTGIKTQGIDGKCAHQRDAASP